MEDPPFDVGAMLGREFGNRKEWIETLSAAEQLAREMDSLLVRLSYAEGLIVLPTCCRTASEVYGKRTNRELNLWRIKCPMHFCPRADSPLGHVEFLVRMKSRERD